MERRSQDRSTENGVSLERSPRKITCERFFVIKQKTAKAHRVITKHQQEARIIEMTVDAHLIVGSDEHICFHQHVLTNVIKHTYLFPRHNNSKCWLLSETQL